MLQLAEGARCHKSGKGPSTINLVEGQAYCVIAVGEFSFKKDGKTILFNKVVLGVLDSENHIVGVIDENRSKFIAERKTAVNPSNGQYEAVANSGSFVTLYTNSVNKSGLNEEAGLFENYSDLYGVVFKVESVQGRTVLEKGTTRTSTFIKAEVTGEKLSVAEIATDSVEILINNKYPQNDIWGLIGEFAKIIPAEKKQG
jgi:hypothetical protein